jgi:hypothetical protein
LGACFTRLSFSRSPFHAAGDASAATGPEELLGMVALIACADLRDLPPHFFSAGRRHVRNLALLT